MESNLLSYYFIFNL